jgi:hypothetical protein
MRTVA